MRESSMKLPTGYQLERDPDMLVLRRPDGVVVGAFSARGMAAEVVRRTVEEIARQERREPETPNPDAPNQGSRRLDAVHSTLRARFFGHFELLCDDEILNLGPNSRALTILKYLLANRGRPVSQDHLMGWLWPESNLKKARWSLNSAIHGLRKLLNGCSVSMNYVLLDEGSYRLSSEIIVSTDVDEFDERYERGRRLEQTGEAAEAAIEYEKAIELYRGDYLVEDLYEDWTMVERERLANAYMDIVGRLAVHYMENGQLRECVRCCYRALEKDRCHEDSYRLLMRCYAQMGQLSSAVRQYRMCEQILGQEYGTSPSPETRSLLYSITMGEARSEDRSRKPLPLS